MWCPRCNRHYDEEFDTCLICGGKLEEYTPILSQEERDVLDLQQEDVAKELVEEAPPAEIMPELLVSVVGEEEARRLAALLESVRIPCLCRPAREEEPEMWEEEYEASPENEYEADEEEVVEEQLTPPQDGEDDAIFDLLIPKMLFPKALRVLNEDSARHEEPLVEEGMLPEFEEEELSRAESDETDTTEQPEKKHKGLFGFFGKKR